jgi:hypothetical protein
MRKGELALINKAQYPEEEFAGVEEVARQRRWILLPGEARWELWQRKIDD